MAKMTDEQKAAAKRLREAKKSRLAWEARQAAAAAREEATKAEREAAFAERVAIMQQRAEALRKAKARATRAARKHAPSALALTRSRNAEARRAAALAARKAEEEARAKAAERDAARTAASVRKPNAEQTPPTPQAAVPRRHYSVTLHDRGGWWELAVFMRRSRSFFVIPFYQRERPEAAEAHRAVIEEITTRLKMGMAAAKPRKPKAPAMPGKQPRETAKIRRIERAMEGV